MAPRPQAGCLARSQRGIFAQQLGVLLAELSVELLGLVRAVQHASKPAAVALKDGAYPHKRGYGFTILMGIHHCPNAAMNTRSSRSELVDDEAVDIHTIDSCRAA